MSETTEPLLMPAAEVSRLTGLSVKVLREMARRGDFPKGVRCGHITVMYPTIAVRKWLSDAMALPAAS